MTNSSEIAQMIQDMTEERIALSAKKSADYATGDDALRNFKAVANICGDLELDVQYDPAACALFLLIVKLARYCNLRDTGEPPKNEAIMDTILDMHNYLDLAYACDIDEE